MTVVGDSVTVVGGPLSPDRPTAVIDAGRGGLLNLLGAAFSALASVGVLLVLTHGFGKTQAGVIFTATSVFVVLEALGRLGSDVSLVYFLSRQRATYGAVLTGILRVALRPVLVVTVLVSAVLLIWAGTWARLLGLDIPAGASYLRILALFLPVASLSNVALGATRGFGAMLPTVAVERLGRPAAQLLVVAVAGLLGVGSLAVLGWSAGYLPAAAASLWWLRRIRRRNATSALRQSPGEFWRFTIPRALAAVNQVVLQRLDLVLVAILRSPAEAAIYAAATRFLVVGQLGVQALSNSVQPPLGSALATGDRGTARELYQTSTAWLVLLVWPLFLTSIVFAPLILRVFGTGYDAGDSAMVVLGFSMLVATGCGLVDVVLIMGGRSGWSLGNSLLALVVNVVLNLLLIPPLGLTGAALSWTATTSRLTA